MPMNELKICRIPTGDEVCDGVDLEDDLIFLGAGPRFDGSFITLPDYEHHYRVKDGVVVKRAISLAGYVSWELSTPLELESVTKAFEAKDIEVVQRRPATRKGQRVFLERKVVRTVAVIDRHAVIHASA